MNGIRTLAVVAPRFAPAGALGGAEALLLWQARAASRAGVTVTFLSTCASDHFTWRNALPAGESTFEALRVRLFPVNEDRDVARFLDLQQRIQRGERLDEAEEAGWIENSVNSRALEAHLREHRESFDRILVGPYLFGLTDAVSRIAPEKTFLAPCLHDEPFARLRRIGELFARVRGCFFNTEPERDLAREIFGTERPADTVVGMGIEPFTPDPDRARERFSLEGPYVLYCGRREELKGTPLLLDYMNTFRLRTGRDLRLVLTGSGPVSPPKALAPHLLDLGFVDEEAKHDVMAGAAVFCHPSLNESLSIVLLESWLAGAPALVHSGSRVLVHQCRRANAGLWFRDYPEFECALDLLLDRPELRAALGARGRTYTQKTYAPEAVAERLVRALNADGSSRA